VVINICFQQNDLHFQKYTNNQQKHFNVYDNFNYNGVIVTQLLWKCDLDANTNSRADAKHV